MKRLRWQAEWAWLAAVLLLLVLGYWWFPGPDESQLDTFSTAAGGKRAFFTVAERLTPPVTRAMENFRSIPGQVDTICMLGPARYPDTNEWNWLADWVRTGNALVFAARQGDPAVDLKAFGVRVVPDQRMVDRHKESESQAEPDDSASGKTDLPTSDSDDGSKRPDGGTTSPTAARQKRHSLFERANVDTPLASGKFQWESAGHIESGSKLEVLVSVGGDPQVVRTTLGNGTLIVCSSDYIFSNKSLATGDNGLLAFRILEAATPDGIVFDESLNASGAPKVLGLLVSPHVRPITLQVLLVTVLFSWWGFRHFGPLQAESAAEHRSMTEHAVALGNLHWKASTGGRALSWYMEYFRNELRLHYATGTGIAEATLLARRAGIDEATATRLLADARHASQQSRVAGSRIASLVREMAQIKNKLDRAKGA